jgi:hypothetical protein
VTDSADDLDLAPIVAAAQHDPAFLAGRVRLAGPDQDLAARLNLDRPRLQRLLLCRPPARSRFAAEVTEIAGLVGAEPALLAALLREVDAVGGLRDIGGVLSFGRPGLLAAARDAAEAHVAVGDEGSARLRELAATFWSLAPDPLRADRDVEAAIAWSTPLAVVMMSPLTLESVQRWLTAHDIPVAGQSPHDEVRGFLVAWRGVGMVFCDGTGAAAERRFTLAHEVGHFILDYAEPRHRVLRDAPDLLQVVDGVRPATGSDRAQALLAGVPIGVHVRLLDGGPGHADRHAEDEASRFALELLTPWDEVVSAIRELAPAALRRTPGQAVALIANRYDIPLYAARTRARQALDAVGFRRGFLDR